MLRIRRVRITSCFVAPIGMLALAAVFAQAQPEPDAPPEPAQFVPGRILVQFTADTTDDQAADVISGLGAEIFDRLPGNGVHVLSLPPQANERALVRAFRQRPEVEFAELDAILSPDDVTPNDPWYTNWEWHLKKIQGPTAWSTTTGSGSVIIAILDTGVDGTHEDLATKMVPGWNVYSNNADTSDVYGHGTPVAGTAAAVSNNGVGVASICWNCLIMPVRVSATDGTATYSAIASALTWAADHGARIANISYMVSTSSTVTSAAQYFQSKGGVVASSAGNYSTFDSSADNPYILTISGTDPNDALYSWSNTGNNIDLAAPGCVYTTLRGGGYANGCGTSFSAPIVAGVAALAMSANPALTPSQIIAILKQSADDLGATGWDSTYGWGRVNASSAVTLAVATTSGSTAPKVSITSPGSGSTVSGSVSIQGSATDSVTVASVTFYVDGLLSCTATLAPYSCPWNTSTANNGAHNLTATARDAAGNSASASITVTVSNVTLDTTPPTISITSPGSGATVSGTISIQASASDNVGVASVSFYVDGALTCTASGSPYSCSWGTTSAANGGHTLMATARDAAGNSSSASVTVTVSNSITPSGDTTPPAISITSPASGTTVSGTVSVSVKASDNVGVAKVELYVDGSLTATSTTAPFTTKWNTNPKGVAKGAHTLQTKAYDAAGNVGISAIVTVNK